MYVFNTVILESMNAWLLQVGVDILMADKSASVVASLTKQQLITPGATGVEMLCFQLAVRTAFDRNPSAFKAVIIVFLAVSAHLPMEISWVLLGSL